jgi:hypothetical protein
MKYLFLTHILIMYKQVHVKPYIYIYVAVGNSMSNDGKKLFSVEA